MISVNQAQRLWQGCVSMLSPLGADDD